MTRDELHEGVDALAYWRERRRALGPLRLGARRECDRMIDAWERRVRDALVRGEVPPGRLVLQAGALIVRARLGLAARRWRRRAGVAAATLAAVAAGTFVVLDALVRAVA